MINKTKVMTVEFLKNLFLEQYANDTGCYDIPLIYVTMVKDDYLELYHDIIRESDGNIVEDIIPDVDKLSFTKITLPFICEFIVKIGEEFRFSLTDEDDQYYEEL